MAIVTGNYKGFTFGDISSKAYGVYITQEAAYDAPERDTEVVEIAGRNGAYILDKGRFKNITVSYKCGIALDSEGDFESAIRAFRNALSAKAGKYVRLEDEYNPDEYRQAAFLGGIDVNMADRRAGEFTVSFDAKPQRFLKSGETAVSVASGGTITNPTLFEAHPLLQVWGYGDILINGEQIVISGGSLGNVNIPYTKTIQYEDITAGSSVGVHSTQTITFDSTFLNSGDRVTISGFTLGQRFFSDYDITSAVPVHSEFIVRDFAINAISAKYSFDDISFYFGQSFSDITRSTDISIEASDSGASYTTIVQMQVRFSYDTANTITVETWGFTNSNASWINTAGGSFPINYTIRGNSSQSALGTPLYFDLEIGEAYKIENDEVVSVNSAVSFPAELPTLKSGDNTITYGNTITQFKIVPRWWEV